MKNLFAPIQLGDLTLQNRVVMAPLTRCRAGSDREPTELMAMYYGQRSGAGLILTEATAISPTAVGYPDTPGIWTEQQIEGWKRVAGEVHRRGSLLFMQLWHVGRVSHPHFLDGALPVAPSAVAPDGFVSLLRPKQPYVTPRALETNELPGLVATYRTAAENAKRAGMDGIELHAANGYLLDQFLQDSTNQRTDAYGGSIENRARLLLEAVDATVSVWGAKRVGVHLAPRGDAHSMGDSNPSALFTYVASQLDQRGIGFLCVRESLDGPRVGPALRKAFTGLYIANEGFTATTAQALIEQGGADAVAFGKDFIANPDLPARMSKGLALNPLDPATMYGYGLPALEKGYTDYSFADES